MNRPVVFLSSVFGGLADIRRRVTDLIHSLGCSVWRAEAYEAWTRTESAQWNAALCLTGVAESDFYLGIFPSRYGSDPLGMAFTELEYHQASGLMMPRFLYNLYDRNHQDPDQTIKQQGLLNLLRDGGISPFSLRPQRVESTKQLLKLIEHDFRDLANRAGKPREVNPWGYSVSPWQQSGSSARLVCTEASVWSERIKQLLEARKVSLSHSVAVGVSHLTDSLREFDPKNRQFLDDFDEYLAHWFGISAWAGITGIFGQTNISKLRIILAQLRGHYGSITELAGSVCSGLYADRKLANAERWYQVYRRHGEIDEMLGPIALARGNCPVALASFEKVLGKPDLSSDSCALHLGYLSGAFLGLGQKRKAEKAIEQAISMQELPSTTKTRVFRQAAETFHILGAATDAQLAIDQAEHLAREAGLNGQLRKAQAAKKRMSLHRLRPSEHSSNEGIGAI